MPELYRRLGIFLTADEREKALTAFTRASNTPVISFVSGMRDMASLAWEDAHRTVHAMALSHGLPETAGFYGVDLSTGELLGV